MLNANHFIPCREGFFCAALNDCGHIRPFAPNPSVTSEALYQCFQSSVLPPSTRIIPVTTNWHVADFNWKEKTFRCCLFVCFLFLLQQNFYSVSRVFRFVDRRDGVVEIGGWHTQSFSLAKHGSNCLKMSGNDSSQELRNCLFMRYVLYVQVAFENDNFSMGWKIFKLLQFEDKKLFPLRKIQLNGIEESHARAFCTILFLLMINSLIT